MECNRDEAVRAKEIAEKKMQNNDFEGAWKIALKAQQLFPELENISQLLAVCSVHCSAQNKICGSERNWYGILQVERLADEATIKKQYRKLALILHPDKNKFPGAEAAFKLIGEANMVLSDQGKRTLYDSKCRVSVRTAVTRPPPHQVNRNPFVGKPYGVQHNIPNAPNSQFGGLNQHQATQPDSSNGGQTFWTCCPFCNVKYQYYRDFVNRALRCSKCQKPFIAYDLGAQGVSTGSNWGQPGAQGVPPVSNRSQPAVSQQKQVPNQGPSKVAFRGNLSSRAVASEPSKVDAKARESGTSRSRSSKRGRNFVVESSESCETASSSDSEGVNMQDNGGNFTAQQNIPEFNGVHHPRRSSRQRQHVSYDESASDGDDFVSPPKRSRGSKLYSRAEEEQKEVLKDKPKSGTSTGFIATADMDKGRVRRKGSALPGGSFQDSSSGKCQAIVEEDVTWDQVAKTSKVMDDTESDPTYGCSSDPEFYDCPDPEFSDFDKDKEENCFAANQIWACYDTVDGMPRFYAHVKKVFTPGFKVQITWLEADPEDQHQIDWVNVGLPVACGKFKRGSSEETSDRLTFSHQVHCEKVAGRCSYVIYPRKGETWALFKDWDIRWSSDPESHKQYKFETVEVVSDFVENSGIKVAYLDKVKGFISLFQQTTREGIVSFLIPPRELFRFSHRIPSFKMTGREREGVPKGSFELDPASLSPDLNEFCRAEEMEMETGSMDVKVLGSCPKSPKQKLKSMVGSENTNTPKKCVDVELKKGFEREASKLRRSPKELNCTGVASSDQGDDEMPIDETSPYNFMKNSSIPPSFSTGLKVSEEVFHNFIGNKSVEKFEIGQIWALYSSKEEGLPKEYAQIKKIEDSPFKLRVALLEPFIVPRNTVQPLCCGMFKVQNAKTKLLLPSSFSHMLKAESIDRNSYEIHPREGEIWALYTNWNAELSCSDLENCEYDIVEVLDGNKHCPKVSSLVRVNGFKSVFKAPRSLQSSTGIMEIPRGELARFSHQIPAFQLTGEIDGYLRGCWELDHASVPGNLFCVN
ncbi:unnamed protein product [Ilex paraguariensis]|uniref:J domain-containing protein n=1 Tax=Ilex paraguariensis TaxID=185542 RepID=A0ABC8UNT6_9AQUA